MLGIKYRKRLALLGADITERTTQYIRMSNTFIAQGASENTTAWAKFILSDFLQRWSQPALIEAKLRLKHDELKAQVARIELRME